MTTNSDTLRAMLLEREREPTAAEVESARKFLQGLSQEQRASIARWGGNSESAASDALSAARKIGSEARAKAGVLRSEASAKAGVLRSEAAGLEWRAHDCRLIAAGELPSDGRALLDLVELARHVLSGDFRRAPQTPEEIEERSKWWDDERARLERAIVGQQKRTGRNARYRAKLTAERAALDRARKNLRTAEGRLQAARQKVAKMEHAIATNDPLESARAEVSLPSARQTIPEIERTVERWREELKRAEAAETES